MKFQHNTTYNLASMLTILLFMALGCTQSGSQKSELKNNQLVSSKIEVGKGSTVATRFTPPEGYERENCDKISFGHYLRNLTLKEEGSKVVLYDGSLKKNQDSHVAVVDMPIGRKNLHQCADAIMRLRAEYLWSHKRYEDIHFNFTNGFRADYNKWMSGERIHVYGNEVKWIQGGMSDDSYEAFWAYLETVFTYAGTASLEKELEEIHIDDLTIGSILIKGGYPGHAVVVLDEAIEMSTGGKVFLLGQSYMPAQEIHVVKNPMDKNLSPWYYLEAGKTIVTPEWSFESREIRRFMN